MSGTPRVFESLDSWFSHYAVKAESGCFNFSGALDHKGYGKIGYGGRTRIASRLAYEKAIGEIPEGMNVCHKCDNPKCINPEHLFLGTQKDNLDDMARKNRRYVAPRKTHCLHGHELVSVPYANQQICLICRKDAKIRWRAKHKCPLGNE